MEPQINAIVIGAGGFGKHYARILSQLNGKGLTGIPFIEKLIVTRTRLESAKDQAAAIRDHQACCAGEVIGAEVNNPRQLVELLDQYEPAFVGIAARDKAIGDEIHAVYTHHAIKYGSVLCEKPFSNATGDGSSLHYFDELFGHENRALFGLELPLAVVMENIKKNKPLREMFVNARRFEFHWETISTPKNYIINDLSLHPWSLIPESYRIESAEVDDQGNTAHIGLELFNAQTGNHATGEITLREGGNFRGMMLDDYSIAVKIKGGLIQLIELDQSLEDAVRVGGSVRYGDVLLEVHNPLEQNIIAVLRHDPLINLERTYDSQLFLEIIHGYAPSP